jgi:hypothetical protein
MAAGRGGSIAGEGPKEACVAGVHRLADEPWGYMSVSLWWWRPVIG